jgi:hypothetical protein
VVSHEDVNVDVGSNEVRSVDKNEVRAGYGEDNPKTRIILRRSKDLIGDQ